MIMKRSDLYRFQEGLEASQLRGRNFTHAVSENKEAVANKIKHLEKEKAPDEEFLAYERELEVFNREWALKDANGVPRVRNIKIGRTRSFNQYIIPGLDDYKSEYAKDLNEFKEKHIDAIKAQEERDEEYKESMEDEIDFEPVMVDFEAVPDEIDQFIMDRIKFMIRKPKKL